MRGGPVRRLSVLGATVSIVTTLCVAGAPLGASAAVGELPARLQEQSVPALRKSGKLSPRLTKLARGLASPNAKTGAAALSLPSSGAGSLVTASDGTTLVYIRTRDTSTRGVARLTALGAHVVNVSAEYSTVTARVAPSAMTNVAADSDVTYVSEALAPAVTPIAAQPRAAGVTAMVCAPTISEGVGAMNVAAARTTNGVDGTGQTIGVLSNSYNTTSTAATRASDDIASGDLPGPANPCGRLTDVRVQSDYSGSGRTDEGRAMLELAHDVAPGANLAFATSANGMFDMQFQISNLYNQNHATVLVDDTAYLDEPFFQDGPISKTANFASSTGVPYFSAAGNDNTVVGGKNVSSYEAPAFRAATCPAGVTFDEPILSCHDFDTTGSPDSTSGITVAPGGGFGIDLQWAQPWDNVTTDFDVFIVNSAGTVVAESELDNFGLQEPVEVTGYTNHTATPQTVSVIIGKYAGAADPRVKYVMLEPSGVTAVEYDESAGTDIVGPAIFGHAGAASVGSTGAIPYDDATTSEDYSSHGPVTHYFPPVPGTTPLATPEVLQKPDFAATDNVQGVFFGPLDGTVHRFAGTSAAAPQAAAIGALLRQYDPVITPAQVMTALHDTARPVANNGASDAVGGGYIDAQAALAGVPAVPAPPPGTVTTTNGNARATLHWNTPVTSPNFPVTGYRVTPWVNGVAKPARVFNSAATTQIVTLLTNGTTYQFTVAALSAAGVGADSALSDPITVGKAGAPASAGAQPGNGTAKVSWAVPTATYGIPITGYRVTPFIGGVAQPARNFASTALTQVITGLTIGTSYQFSVAAKNASSVGFDSALTKTVIVGAPASPTAVVVTPGSDRATIRWTAPAANGSPITGYAVSAWYLDGNPVGTRTFSGTQTSRVLAPLFPGSHFLLNGNAYRFTVAAINARGTGSDSALTPAITIGAPLAPTGVTATAAHASAKLRWTAPANNGAAITRYTVTPYIAGVAKAPRVFNNNLVDETITGLITGQKYTFRVTATNSRGTSVPSAPSAVVTIT
jgi:hypothetical protein